MNIGKNIKKYRKEAGLTQKKLGELSGTSERTIQQYETGKRQPRLEQLRKVADALNIPMYQLTEMNYLKFYDTKEIIDDFILRANETKSDIINELFDSLNEKGKDKAIEQVKLVSMIPDYQNGTPDQDNDGPDQTEGSEVQNGVAKHDPINETRNTDF